MFINLKTYMKFFIILISMLSFSSLSSSWLLMEINSFNLYSFMDKDNNNKSPIFKYFIIQTITSLMILMSISMSNDMEMIKMLIMLISTMTKMGIMPLHLWMPEIIQSMSWKSIFIMLSTQKSWPLYFFMSITMNSYFNFMMMIMFFINLIGSSMMIIQKNSMKWILTYSSMFHSSWMTLTCMTSMKMGMFYLINYSLNLMILIFFFYKYNINSTNSFNKLNLNFTLKILIMWLFFTMSAFPPSSGFMIKMITINLLINKSMYMYMLPSIMMILSLLFSLSYLMSINSLMFMKTSKTFKPFNKHYTLYMMSTFSIMMNMYMLNLIYLIS